MAVLVAVTALAATSASAQITIPTVPIGNPGNAADPTTGFGAVSYTYNIGRTEVTNAQYAAFLNAKAASDPFGLYNTDMAGSFGGITRSGSAGSYIYSTVTGRANNPVTWVSLWDACRFCNWLHNGQGSGDTETGAYTLTPGRISANTITRNANWQWAVTSENEWYKAAYHQPASRGGDSDNYWLYPTSSDSVPTTAQTNISGNGINNTVPVGSYAANFYGTFDMAGNVWEWNEAIILNFNRGVRGGSFFGVVDPLRAGSRDSSIPTREFNNVGFRVSRAAVPPCPADVNTDGTVDAHDIIAFFAAWDASHIAADFSGDGGVDSDDVIAFFARWDAGC
jgi:sulfatase modifying factor 1